jgi:hypothetical protein
LLSSLELSDAAFSFSTSSGFLKYTMMQVMLSVPVPSDYVTSPLAIPWFIISSMMNEVSPLGFFSLVGEESSEDFLPNFKGALPYFFPKFKLFSDLSFVGERPNFPVLGPASFFLLTYLTASSLVKQSHIPSQALIMKSTSADIGTSLTSGNPDT